MRGYTISTEEHLRDGVMQMPKYAEWLSEEGLTKIEGWARDGLTDEQISHNMGISSTTLYNWKRDHLEILKALKKGKEVVDIQVENALLKRALGYEYDEITTEYGQETKRIRKQVVPDTTAQIFWLKNRRPDKWRDRHDIEHGGQIGGVTIVNDIPKPDKN